MWMVCWVRIQKSSSWYGEDWWVRYGAGLYMLHLCLLWRCQCTYALTRPGGLLSEISRCFRHWSEHWVSRYFLYDFSLLCGLARVTLCGVGDFGSRRGGSTCPTAFCMRCSRSTAPWLPPGFLSLVAFLAHEGGQGHMQMLASRALPTASFYAWTLNLSCQLSCWQRVDDVLSFCPEAVKKTTSQNVWPRINSN